MAESTMKTTCLTPKCGNAQYCRGVCTACYQVVLRAIKAGKTTMVKLEREGKLNKVSRRGGPMTKRATWLVGE